MTGYSAALITSIKEATMWQVILVFLFAAALAWLVSESPRLMVRRRFIDDEEWARWMDDLRREYRR